MALIGFLVVGAAAASILGRSDIPAPPPELASPVAQGPVANRGGKTDKLAVAGLAPAPAVPPQAAAPMNDPLRLAFASTTADIDAQSIVTPPPTPLVPLAPSKPKLAGKPPPQKAYALLSDAQIAGIKDRLRLSSSQEYYWPSVETALRNVARKINAERLSNPHAGAAQLDPDCEEVQQLKSAAMPLLFQLRDDQKDEVRKLARIIGLEKVAAAI
jgi:hypothetical protein